MTDILIGIMGPGSNPTEQAIEHIEAILKV